MTTRNRHCAHYRGPARIGAATLVGAALGLLALPSIGIAAQVNYGLTGTRASAPTDRYTRFVYSASPGETNRVTAFYAAASGFRVSDAGAAIAIGALPGDPWSQSCANAGPQTVVCSRPRDPAGASIISRFLAPEVVFTADGDDVVRATGADWVVDGGLGNDNLSGGLRALGSEGHDRIAGSRSQEGGPGNDRLYAPARVSSALSGGPGNDSLYGRGAVFNGGPGNDRLFGGGTLEGYVHHAGPGNDVVNVRNRVRDTLNCGSGFDSATIDRTDRAVLCERVRRL